MGSKKHLLLPLAAAAGAFILYGLVRFLSENEETRIRKVVYKGVVAVEKKDIARCASLISDDYRDPYGDSKATVLYALKELFKEYSHFRVVIKQLKIEIKEPKAVADIGVTFYFKKAQDTKVYYDSGKIKVTFRKEDGRWKVYEAEYIGLQELLFFQTVA